MNTFLWVLQIALALAFAMAGQLKLTQPKAKLAESMAWVEDFSPSTIKLIGALELTAALGLVLPAATGIVPVLTPAAATGLAVLMVLAAATHVRRKEVVPFALVNAVLLAIAVVIAWGRFGPHSL